MELHVAEIKIVRLGNGNNMIVSYNNNLFFKGSMELHVAEIIIILLGVGKQHVRFILFSNKLPIQTCHH